MAWRVVARCSSFAGINVNVRSLTIRVLDIPFVDRFKHSMKDRGASDAMVATVMLDDGTIGYGEGLPRSYVTGETTETVVEQIRSVLAPALHKSDLDVHNPLESIDQALGGLDLEPNQAVHAHHSARCLLELATLDALLKSQNEGIEKVVPARRHQMTYSGVIGGSSLEGVSKRARQMRYFGLQQIKIKVGVDDVLETVSTVRSIMGDEANLRVDANGAWTLDQAKHHLTALEPLGVVSCEEPLAPRDWQGLAELRQSVSIPLMADESFVTQDDLEALITHRAIDAVNIRLSKNGGLRPCLEFAAKAQAAGLWYQIGAHVGETAILSSAGRHLAAHLDQARFIEGSFGTLLLREDLSEQSIMFGKQGLASRLTGPGLGIDVIEARLDRFTRTRHELVRP